MMVFNVVSGCRRVVRWSPVGRRAVVAVAVCLLLLSRGTSLSAEEEKPADNPKTAEKPQVLVLFDGKTLEGWKTTEFGGEGAVEVKEGAVILNRGGSMTGITSTRKDLPKTNYELRYEAVRLAGFDFFADRHLSGGRFPRVVSQRRLGRQRNGHFQHRRLRRFRKQFGQVLRI